MNTQLVGRESPLLDEVIDLLESRIPKKELLSRSLIKRILVYVKSEPHRFRIIAFVSGGVVVAVAVGSFIENNGLCFMSYIVVKKEFEGKGLGLLARSELIRVLEADAKQLGVTVLGFVGEVAATSPWLKKLISEGAIILPVKYVQPSMGEGSSNLKLYFQPTKSFQNEVDVDFAKFVVKAIYSEIYRIKDPSKNQYFRQIVFGV